jgi:hypothetical protein
MLVASGSVAAGPLPLSADSLPVRVPPASPVSLDGHTLTWTTSGVSPIPAGRTDLADDWDGVVYQGSTVNLSGSAVYAMGGGAGFHTGLSQMASLDGGYADGTRIVVPAVEKRQDATGNATYAMPFSLNLKVPAALTSKSRPGSSPATDPFAVPVGYVGYVIASMSSRNCADGGCGGPEVILKFAILTAPPTPTAAPKPTLGAPGGSLNEASEAHLSPFLARYNTDQGYTKYVQIGKDAKYKECLKAVVIVVDPTLKGADGAEVDGSYSLDTNTLKLRNDPRTTPLSDTSMGKRIWHECTHWLEGTKGDTGSFDSQEWAERNITYMEEVLRGLSALDVMERKAKAGASTAELRRSWNFYIKVVTAAAKLPEPAKYPPKRAQLRDWFGFNAQDASIIRKFYATGRALPGAAGKALAAAVR